MAHRKSVGKEKMRYFTKIKNNERKWIGGRLAQKILERH